MRRVASVEDFLRKAVNSTEPHVLFMAQLKQQLEAQLDRSSVSGSDDGVASRYVRSGAAAAEQARRQGIPVANRAEAVRPSVRVGKIRMVENVKKLGAKLAAEPLPESPNLENRNVPVAEARISEEAAGHAAESSEGGSHHDRLAFRVTAKLVQRTARASRPRGGGTHRLVRGGLCSGELRRRGIERVLQAFHPTPCFECAAAVRDCGWARSEVRRISDEVPAIREITSLADVAVGNAAQGSAAVHRPRLAALESNDGIDLPPFQQLERRFPSGNVIAGCESEMVPDVKVAAGVIR
jgi:hypothetical protein